jgi:hypothetical protein
MHIQILLLKTQNTADFVAIRFLASMEFFIYDAGKMCYSYFKNLHYLETCPAVRP